MIPEQIMKYENFTNNFKESKNSKMKRTNNKVAYGVRELYVLPTQNGGKKKTKVKDHL